MTEDDQRPSWHHAAARARFTFYEPVAPSRSPLWAGGFGGGDETGPDLIELMASVGGVEVSVETRRRQQRLSLGEHLRVALGKQVWPFVLEADADLAMPMTINVIADDRAIDVDGQATLFTGVRIDGQPIWTGLAQRDDVVITVSTANDVDQLSIAPCRDWSSLPEWQQ